MTGLPTVALDRVQRRLRDRAPAMLDFVHALVALESPSSAPERQGPVLDVIAERLGALGFRCRRLSGRGRTGPHLFARRARRARGAPLQLLLGHADTVWPLGTLAERPPRVEGGRFFAPGGYDMKAGLAQALFALEALRHLDVPLTVEPVLLVNSDEEIGSPTSTPWIRRLAGIADRSLVLEPSLGAEGALKTARKGVGRFTVTAVGRAAHAGLDPEAGVSAILELSHQVQALFALNEPERGISVNVGLIEGGIRPNVVAPESRAVVDVRVPTEADAARVEAAIRALEPAVPGVTLRIDGRMGRPPMERTEAGRRLWERARVLGAALGLRLEEATAGGGSDGNTTARLCATLDGLGPVGAGAHAEHEQVLVSGLPERAALLAALLASPPLSARSEEA